MKKRLFAGIVFLVVFTLLSMNFIVGVDDVWGEEGGMSDSEFITNFESDPAGGFAANPVRAWKALESNPDLMLGSKVHNAAFTRDPMRAAGVLNENLDLMKSSSVRERFSLAAHDENILNDNPEAKREWLKEEYSLGDEGAKVVKFDGTEITTEKGTYTLEGIAKHFPEAKFLEDGTLNLGDDNIVLGTTHFYLGEDDKYHMEKGTFVIQSDEKMDNHILVTNGFIEIKEELKDANGEIVKGVFWPTKTFMGSFSYHDGKEGLEIKSLDDKGFTFEYSKTGQYYSSTKKDDYRYHRVMDVFGKIIDPGSKPGEFILVGDTTLKIFEDGSELRVQGEDDTRVYYTEVPDREAAKFCTSSFSCIVNSPGELEPKYASRLAFLNIQNEDTVTFETQAFYDNVEVDGLENGGVRFISIDEKNVFKSEVVVYSNDESNPENKIKVEGLLAETNAGRFDVIHEDPACEETECRQILHHWSSSGKQSKTIERYFNKEGQSFVTCKVGANCEERFAKHFGKIIGPEGKEPTTTIIVAGGSATVANQLSRGKRSWCEREGCYILNSRDAPPTTQSKHLVITGHHHSANPDNVYQYVPGMKVGMGRIFYNDVEEGSKFDHLPDGPIETVHIGACTGTLKPRKKHDYEFFGLDELSDHYNGLYSVHGYSRSMNPDVDPIALPYFSSEDISGYVRNWKGEKDAGAWFVKAIDEEGLIGWYWTSDGRTFIDENGEVYQKKDLEFVEPEPPKPESDMVS